jgi:hypothetical protein
MLALSDKGLILIAFTIHFSQPNTQKFARPPYEIICLVADFLFELKPSSHTGNVENETICCVKPKWHNVVGFMNASPDLHQIGLEHWVSVLTIRTPQDLDNAIFLSHHVRYGFRVYAFRVMILISIVER